MLVVRLLASVAAVGLFGVTNSVLSNTGRVLSGEVAVHQFDNSDTSYIASQTAIAHMTNWGIPGVIFLVILGALWFAPVKRLFSAN